MSKKWPTQYCGPWLSIARNPELRRPRPWCIDSPMYTRRSAPQGAIVLPNREYERPLSVVNKSRYFQLRLCSHSSLHSCSPASQKWRFPTISVNLHDSALLVRERNLALFIETTISQITYKPITKLAGLSQTDKIKLTSRYRLWAPA